MTIKKIETGIFDYDEISDLTKSERKRLRGRALSLLNLEKRLDNLWTVAREVLEKAGIRFIPRGMESKLSAEDWRKHPELTDAMEILNYIGILRDHLKEGQIEKAALCALNLGQISTRLLVRPHEKPAIAGRKALSNLEKGRTQGQDRYSDARERHFDWHERSLTMRGTTREIADEIAVQTGYRAETIRKALQKFRNKK